MDAWAGSDGFDRRGIGPRGSRYDTDADRKMAGSRFTAWVGRQITGDLSITRERFSLYARSRPVSCLSILLSLLITSFHGSFADDSTSLGEGSSPRWYGVSALRLCPSASAESIRVLLAQEAPFLDVRSDGAFALVKESGETKTLHGPIHLTARGDGLHLDGRRLAGERVQLRPLRHTDPGHRERRRAARGPHCRSVGRCRCRGRGMRWRSQTRLTWKEYVKGVVPPKSVRRGIRNIKGQAVAARTYALYKQDAQRLQGL